MSKKRKLNDIRQQYHHDFITLTQCLVDDSLSLDEYREMLHLLMDSYRKEKMLYGYA